jgi:hypothetical protein
MVSIVNTVVIKNARAGAPKPTWTPKCVVEEHGQMWIPLQHYGKPWREWHPFLGVQREHPMALWEWIREKRNSAIDQLIEDSIPVDDFAVEAPMAKRLKRRPMDMEMLPPFVIIEIPWGGGTVCINVLKCTKRAVCATVALTSEMVELMFEYTESTGEGDDQFGPAGRRHMCKMVASEVTIDAVRYPNVFWIGATNGRAGMAVTYWRDEFKNRRKTSIAVSSDSPDVFQQKLADACKSLQDTWDSPNNQPPHGQIAEEEEEKEEAGEGGDGADAGGGGADNGAGVGAIDGADDGVGGANAGGVGGAGADEGRAAVGVVV